MISNLQFYKLRKIHHKTQTPGRLGTHKQKACFVQNGFLSIYFLMSIPIGIQMDVSFQKYSGVPQLSINLLILDARVSWSCKPRILSTIW